MLYCAILCYTVLYYTILYYTILYYTILYYPILCYAMLCSALLCSAMLCYAMLRYAALRYAALRCAALRYAMLCYAMLCFAILSSPLLSSTLLYSALLCSTLLYSSTTLLYSPCYTHHKENWLADMQVLLSGMKKQGSRCKVCISGRQPCMSARYFHRSAGRFCIFSRHPCMSARRFDQSAGPFTILPLLLFYYFIFHWVPGKWFLHLEPPPLHVGPPFSPVGRTVYYFFLICRLAIFTGRPGRLVLYCFYYFTFSFPLGSRLEVFACTSARHFQRSAGP